MFKLIYIDMFIYWYFENHINHKKNGKFKYPLHHWVAKIKILIFDFWLWPSGAGRWRCLPGDRIGDRGSGLVLCVAHYCRLWRRLECRAQLQSRDQRPRIEDRGRGKGKGRQPIENTFVAGETATTISSWAVSANSRHFPRKMATASLEPQQPQQLLQLPMPIVQIVRV